MMPETACAKEPAPADFYENVKNAGVDFFLCRNDAEKEAF